MGTESLAGGTGNTVNANHCLAFGEANIAGGGTDSESCIALGDNNDAFGHDTFCAGEANATNGKASAAVGYLNTVTGVGSAAIGRDNVVGTSTGVIALISCASSVAVGCSNNIQSDFSGCFGTYSAVPIGYNYSYTLGSRLTSNAASTVTIGRGLDTNPIINNSTNSLMVGFNSSYPTLYVFGGNGTPGTFGNVGIGLNASTVALTPSERLDVNGNARFRNIADNADNVLVTGTTNAAGDYTLSRIDFGTNTNQYLENNATWQTIPTGESTTANNGTSLSGTAVQLGNDVGGTAAQLTNNRVIPMNNFDIYFDDPAVGSPTANCIGIGTTLPTAKLHVQRTLTSSLSTQPTAVYAQNSDAVQEINSTTPDFVVGIHALAHNNGFAHNRAMWAFCQNGLRNTGLRVDVTSNQNNGLQHGTDVSVTGTTGSTSYGNRVAVIGNVSSTVFGNSNTVSNSAASSTNYGSFTSLSGTTSSINYGVLTEVSTSNATGVTNYGNKVMVTSC